MESSRSGSLRTRIVHRVMGDPADLPRRLMEVVLFVICMATAASIYLTVNWGIDTSGSVSSIHPVLRHVTSVWIIIPIGLFFFRSVLFFRKRQWASIAAVKMGWDTESVLHLADEIRTTDGCTRVMVTSQDSFDYIENRVSSALNGGADDLVDFSEPPAEDTDSDETLLGDAPESAPDLWVEHGSAGSQERRSVEEAAFDGLEFEDATAAVQAAESGADALDTALFSGSDWQSGQADRETHQAEPGETGVIGRASAAVSAAAGTAWAAVATAIAIVWSVATTVLKVATAPVWYPISLLLPEPRERSDTDERDVPWLVRVQEEFKHLTLDIQSGWRKSELVVKLFVPAGVVALAILMPLGLWVPLHVFALVASVSLLVGIAFFGISKRRLQRRLERHREDDDFDYWQDVAGQVKTVETADQTCYMGFVGGRRYASYDRDEFVSKVSKVLWQRANGHHVHPTILEHNARAIAQYKPLLDAYLNEHELPDIMHELRDAVLAQPEEIITRSDLAWQVCEPGGRFYERNLGHDPEIVADAYAYMVEHCMFDEVQHTFEHPDAGDVEVTLVFPVDKSRSVEADVLHAEFNERFLTEWGDPIYPMPDVDPADTIQAHTPTASAAEAYDIEDDDGSPPALPAAE